MIRLTLLPCFVLFALTCLGGTGVLRAAELTKSEKVDAEKAAAKAGKKQEGEKKKDDSPKLAITHHSTTVAGQEIAYTATAGKMLMKSDDGKAKASIFFVAYTKDGDKKGSPNSDRPITFCFNGGPGSSSVWLHLGMLGPQRLEFDADGKRARPPHSVTDNPFSLLDKTDLVFIDPVSTGFSRPAKGESKRQFHGYDEDVRSVGQFIHDYTTKYGRWGSPKFLLGESYGGLRAAGLSGQLQGRYHMYLNGVVLVSAVVDFQTLRASGNNDVAYALFLPSYTSTAWYHKALPEHLLKQPIEAVVAEAESFASKTYLHALLAGDSLPDEQRKLVIARMAELTGLSADYLDRANLRVSMSRFGKELLRDRRLVVGRFDSRYTGVDSDAVGDRTEHDPSGSAFFGPFTSAMNQYLRDHLQVEEERVYEILTGNVQPWDYSEFTNRFVDASDTLRRAMTNNPHLKVFAACGYYDLATPGYAMEYTRDHLGLPAELRKNFSLAYYEGGHMMYVYEPSLKKLRKDLLKFYDSALKSKSKE